MKFIQILPQLPTGPRATNYLLGSRTHLDTGDCEDMEIAGNSDTNYLSDFTVSFSNTTMCKPPCSHLWAEGGVLSWDTVMGSRAGWVDHRETLWGWGLILSLEPRPVEDF